MPESKAGKYVNMRDFMQISGFPSLEFIGDGVIERMDFSGCGAGALTVENCSALLSVDAEQSLAETVTFENCPLLTELTLTNSNVITLVLVAPLALVWVGAGQCALTESAVDAVLAALDGLGTENGTVELDGGTNAIPSAAGLTSKANLEGKGWTVTVNT